MSKDNPREYGSGSVYQRKSDGRWVGVVKAGYTKSGARGRTTVTSKGCPGGCPKKCGHRAAILRKLRDAKAAAERGQEAANRTTVKTWADTYLKMRVHDLAPKAYNAAANPIKNWVVPTIGQRRLDQLTPTDIRDVAQAQRKAGRQAADTHRAMMTMLRAAIVEGHAVPQRVLLVEAPKSKKSDREGMTVPEGLACLKAAGDLPHGTRWLVTLVYGMRLGECLGLTWDAIDFGAGEFGEIVIEWQLQPLPYNTPRDRSSGFRVPDGYEARHLVDSFHLVRPKSRQGYRVAPLLPAVREALLAWRDVAPANPWGLVWPTAEGRPANDKHDRAEWWGLQNVAEVGHPAGRPYHVHECRNFAATMLLEAGIDEHIVTSLLGHSSVITSRKYMTVRRAPLLAAMTSVGERLGLSGPATP